MGIHPPRHGLSLCAGGGGLDMGLDLAEPGFRTRCYVEREEYPRQSIIAAQRAGYFDPAPIWTDLTTFDGHPWRGIIDTVLAGYPCQPFSHAGQRRGADDPRHLWPHVARVIGEVQPPWVFLENVSGHVSLGAETVLRELWGMGWTPAAGLFTAAETGAPHRRERWFCVAYRDTDAYAGRMERGRSGDGASEGQGQGQGEKRQRVRAGAGGSGRNLADAPSARSETTRIGADLRRDRERGREQVSGDGRGAIPVFPPGPSDRSAWAAVIADDPSRAPALARRDLARAALRAAALLSPDEADAIERRARGLEGADLLRAVEREAAGMVDAGSAVTALRRMADGMAARTRALRLLGNGVCPIQAAYAWRTLSHAHGLGRVDLEAAERGAEVSADGV